MPARAIRGVTAPRVPTPQRGRIKKRPSRSWAPSCPRSRSMERQYQLTLRPPPRVPPNVLDPPKANSDVRTDVHSSVGILTRRRQQRCLPCLHGIPPSSGNGPVPRTPDGVAALATVRVGVWVSASRRRLESYQISRSFCRGERMSLSAPMLSASAHPSQRIAPACLHHPWRNW